MTKEEAIKHLRFVLSALNENSQIAEPYRMAIKALEQGSKTGHWIIYDVHGHKACKCSECDKDVGYPCNYKYCPYCGHFMIKPQESEDKAEVEDKTQPKKPSLWWKCERCGKLIPYMADFCNECANKLLGEPPKLFKPQESEEKCKNCEYYINPDYTRCHECKTEREDEG